MGMANPFESGIVGPKVAEVTHREMIAHHAIAALDRANRTAEHGLSHDIAVSAFNDARASLARIVELIQHDGRVIERLRESS